MTRDPVTVAEDDPLETVVELMERRRIKRLPVRARRQDGRHRQPRQSHARAWSALRATPRRPPAAIPQFAIGYWRHFAKQPWAPQVNVVVKNGVAELWGTITDERERQACIVAAENVAGVTGSARSSGLGRADVRHGVSFARRRS